MATRAFLGMCVDCPRFGERPRGLAEQALIVVSKEGRITSVGRGAEIATARERLERDGVELRVIPESQVLVPGFIDTHIHFPQFPFTGAGIDKPLMGPDGFLTKYAFPTEESMASTARSVYGMAMETLLSHGTTTALIFASIHLEASKELVDLALAKQGPRALVGKVCVDRHCPDSYIETTETSLMATEEFIKYTQLRGTESGGTWPYLVQPVVTPRFLPTSSPELLRGLGELAQKYQCMIQSHMSESLDEVDFSAHLFDSADAEVFARFGLLQGQPGQAASVMAHCVQMKQAELSIMKESGASIAHCPLSNFFFAHGALPVKQLIGQGMKVGLGTDVAGGYSPSMLSAMRAAVLASKSLQFRSVPGGVSESNMAPTCTVAEAKEMHDLNHFEALYLATMGGATALGLAEHLGTFDEGKCFDAVLLNRWRGGSPADSPEDMLLKIITLGDDRNVQEVFVNGRCVYQIDST